VAQRRQLAAERAEAAADKSGVRHRVAAGGRLGEFPQVLKGRRVFFFAGRPAGAGLADPVGGPALKPGVEFLAAAADGIDVEAGD
jgi:hypothetical protein